MLSRPSLMLRAMLLLSAGGCKGADPEQTPRSTPVEAQDQPANLAGEACDEAHAEVVRAQLLRHCELRAGQAPQGIAVVDHAPGVLRSHASNVRLERDGSTLVNGLNVDQQAGVGLKELLEIYAAHSLEPKHFNLKVHADVASARVRELLQELEGLGFDEGVLILGTKAKASVPEPPDARRVASAMGWLQPKTGNARVAETHVTMTDLMASCEATMRAWAKLEQAEPGRYCEARADGVSRALVECDCPVEETDIRSLLYASDVIDLNTSMAVELRLRLDPALEFPTGATWQDVVDGLVLGEQPIVLGLTG